MEWSRHPNTNTNRVTNVPVVVDIAKALPTVVTNPLEAEPRAKNNIPKIIAPNVSFATSDSIPLIFLKEKSDDLDYKTDQVV